MAAQRPNNTGNGRDNRRDDNEDIANLLFGGLVAAGALIGAGIAGYATYRMLSEGESNEQRRCLTESSSSCNSSFRNSRPRSIVIAVDATPARAGGLLVLPEEETVYFYSMDWASLFTFTDEPDKFEMINALLALEIFKEYVATYREEHLLDNLVLKTDSKFCESPATVYRRQKDEKYRKVFDLLATKLQLEPFNGGFERTTDKYIRMADKLSRRDCSFSNSLPNLGDYPEFLNDHQMVNLSMTKLCSLNELQWKLKQMGLSIIA